MQWRKDTGVKVAQACMSGNKICACKKLDTTYTPNGGS